MSRRRTRDEVPPPGPFAPRFEADIVFLDLGHVNYVPLSNPLTQLVNAENGVAIASVMIAGCFVLDPGKLLAIDDGQTST
jgi:5-methylthioadenosine/S-adenosylhomocysteine deaminase